MAYLYGYGRPSPTTTNSICQKFKNVPVYWAVKSLPLTGFTPDFNNSGVNSPKSNCNPKKKITNLVFEILISNHKMQKKILKNLFFFFRKY